MGSFDLRFLGLISSGFFPPPAMDYCNGCSSGFCSCSADPFQDCQPASPPGIQWDHDPMLLHSLQQTLLSEAESSHTELLNQVDAEGPSSRLPSCHRMGEGLSYESALTAEDWQSLDDLLFSAFDHNDAGDTIACQTPQASCGSREFGPSSGVRRGDVDDQNVRNDEKHDESCRKRHQKFKNRNLAEKRRRSMINEKIEALHALIPNSIKRDKVSMLDDVVEYMKSLQQQLQNASMGDGPDTSHSEPFAREAYLVEFPHLFPFVGLRWPNRMLRRSGNAELQHGGISHVAFLSPFPQPFVAGASAMPLIPGALPLPWPVAPMNWNCQRLDSSEQTVQNCKSICQSRQIHFSR